ncbi:hypothetical protein N431DRAFT_498454 [Stipitochalara longipes BDJ]|nr:hypothetical protein N431DRAFT_498454 [Stipitochalara longipes BDJ]
MSKRVQHSLNDDVVVKLWADITRTHRNFLKRRASDDLFRSIAKEASERSSIILFSWHTLGMLLDRHEGTLRNRWIKKSQTWRKTILSKTWPNMPLFHRPDIHHLSREAIRLAENETVEERPKGAFMWPHINMEDLSRDKPILCLLNTRARCPPATLVDYELDNCALGIISGTIVPLQLYGYSMQLEGDTVQTYGKVVAMGVDNGLRAGFTPGDGLLILEIQQKTIEFLIKLCEAILDKTTDALLTQFSAVSQLAHLEIVSSWRTIENLTTYAPYIPPQNTCFKRLADYLFARHSIAQDHISALRENPGYFEDTVFQFGEHRPEGIRDSLRRISSSYDEPPFWDRTLLGMVDNIYRSIVLWDVLFKQVLVVLAIEKQYAGELDPGYPLPPEYKKQIRLFHGLLKYCAEDQRQILNYLLPTSPLLRESFARMTVNGNTAFVARDNADLEQDPLLWIFLKIWDPAEYNYYGHKAMVDEMERLVFSQPEQRKRISPMVAEHFSGFGLLLLMQLEIEHYHPWAAEFAFLDQENMDWIAEEVPTILSADFFELGEKAVSFVLNEFGTPHHLKFSYPCDQRQTRDNAQAMWKAEKNLDLFWQEADRQFQKMTGKTLVTTFANRFTVNFELERTPEWIEPCEQLLTEQDARKHTKAKTESLEKDMSDLQLQAINSPNPGQAIIPAEWKQLFKLDQRGFRVFKALFYMPSDQDGPKEIAWGDFLHFMSGMRFMPMKLYGNLWHFFHEYAQPTQFYEPQPDSRILLCVAMRMGRRLKRTYEWHPEMFVLKEGEGEGKKKGKKKGKGKAS